MIGIDTYNKLQELFELHKIDKQNLLMLGREIIQPINLDTADLNNPKKELPEY